MSIQSLIEESKRPKAQLTVRITRNEKNRIEALCSIYGIRPSDFAATAVRQGLAELTELHEKGLEETGGTSV